MDSRVTEPSTSAGAAAIVLSLLPMIPAQWQWIGQVVTGLFGALAMYQRERS